MIRKKCSLTKNEAPNTLICLSCLIYQHFPLFLCIFCYLHPFCLSTGRLGNRNGCWCLDLHGVLFPSQKAVVLSCRSCHTPAGSAALTQVCPLTYSDMHVLLVCQLFIWWSMVFCFQALGAVSWMSCRRRWRGELANRSSRSGRRQSGRQPWDSTPDQASSWTWTSSNTRVWLKQGSTFLKL